ncbi:MAG: hypothetical protein ACPGU5_01410 [Lishizhenia sp.]
MKILLFFGLTLSFISCKETIKDVPFTSQTVKISTLFDKDRFENKTKEQLLQETGICNTASVDSSTALYPCSPRYFEIYPYSDKLKLENGFILQTKANVNGFPARRMIIFVRENGKLVTMNKIIGYLVEKRTSPSGFDDLVVAVVDNVGGYYDRYDVLIQYKEGKYQFTEALGDLQGAFDNVELKKEATKQIKARVIEHNLFY